MLDLRTTVSIGHYVVFDSPVVPGHGLVAEARRCADAAFEWCPVTPASPFCVYHVLQPAPEE